MSALSSRARRWRLPMVQGEDFETVLLEASLRIDTQSSVIIDHQDDGAWGGCAMNEPR